MGENDNDTYANINRANYDFDDEAFTDISDEAKDFISKLLLKNKEYEFRKKKKLVAISFLHLI
jgi:myosin-light-chain kinase